MCTSGSSSCSAWVVRALSSDGLVDPRLLHFGPMWNLKVNKKKGACLDLLSFLSCKYDGDDKKQLYSMDKWWQGKIWRFPINQWPLIKKLDAHIFSRSFDERYFPFFTLFLFPSIKDYWCFSLFSEHKTMLPRPFQHSSWFSQTLLNCIDFDSSVTLSRQFSLLLLLSQETKHTRT